MHLPLSHILMSSASSLSVIGSIIQSISDDDRHRRHPLRIPERHRPRRDNARHWQGDSHIHHRTQRRGQIHAPVLYEPPRRASARNRARRREGHKRLQTEGARPEGRLRPLFLQGRIPSGRHRHRGDGPSSSQQDRLIQRGHRGRTQDTGNAGDRATRIPSFQRPQCRTEAEGDAGPRNRPKA